MGSTSLSEKESAHWALKPFGILAMKGSAYGIPSKSMTSRLHVISHKVLFLHAYLICPWSVTVGRVLCPSGIVNNE